MLTDAAGHVAFFSFIAELKEPKDYVKSLFLLQITNTILYTVAAVVIYRYAGADVVSPALGSAGPIAKKVAYGVAIPTVRANFGSVLTWILTNRLNRLSSLELSTATSHPNMYTSACFAVPTTCQKGAGSRSEYGYLLSPFFGSSPGLSPRQFRSSTTF